MDTLLSSLSPKMDWGVLLVEFKRFYRRKPEAAGERMRGIRLDAYLVRLVKYRYRLIT